MGAELNSDGGVLCVSTVRTREVAKVCDGVHFWVRSRNYGKRILASLCQSVLPHGTTLFPLYGYLWNLKFEYFSKNCRKVEVSLKSDKNSGYFT